MDRCILLLAAYATVVGGTILYFAQDAWPLVASVLLADGLVVGAWAIAGTLLGLAVIDRIAPDAGRLRLVTAMATGLGLLSLSVLGLGLIGAMNRPVALILLLGSAAAGIVPIVRRRARSDGSLSIGSEIRRVGDRLAMPVGWGWLWLATAPMLGIALCGASMLPGMLWKPGDPHPYDVTSYHLQVPREWFEMGRISPLPHNIFSYFPFAVEMHYLWLMHLYGGVWAAMYASQLTSTAWSLLTAWAVWATVWELRHGRTGEPSANRPATQAAATAAGVAVVTPWLTMLAAVCYVEPATLAYTALAVAWAIRALRTSGDAGWETAAVSFEPANPAANATAGPSTHPIAAADGAAKGVPSGSATATSPAAADDAPAGSVTPLRIAATGVWVAGSATSPWIAAAVGGAMAGLACGTKLTAGPMLLLAAPVAMLAAGSFGSVSAIARRLSLAAVFLVVGLAVFSPWAVRNLAWTGNPVFPNAASSFGRGPMTPEQQDRYAIAHSPRPDQRSVAGRMSAAWNEIFSGWRFGYFVIPLGIVACVLARRHPAGRLLGGMLLLQFVFWIAETHLIGRFAVLMLPVAAIAIGLLPMATRRGRLIAAGVAVAVAVLAVGPMRREFERFAPIGRQGLFGLRDTREIAPLEVLERIDAGDRLTLVGDAQAFLQPLPMTRLRYRGVFDVQPAADGDAIRAWTGLPLSGLDANEWLVVQPAEVQRLSSTYAHVPPLPATLPGPRDRAFLINREGKVIIP